MVLTEEQKQYYNRSVTDGIADDLVLLTDITDNGVAQVLTARYERDDMYTAIGPVLIAVNPYRLIFKGGQALYAEDVARHYYKSSPLEVAPHIFLIASEAYKNMMDYSENQTIIVTGESGAGKTEAAKQLMTFTTFICADEEKSVPVEVEQQRAPSRRMSVKGGVAVSLDALSLAERIDAQRKMPPEDKVTRALAELDERDSVNKKLRTRNVKSRQSKNVLAALMPNSQESKVLRTSAENEAELRETFESLCVEDESGDYIDLSTLKDLGQVDELLEMKTIDEDFLMAVMKGVTGEHSADPTQIRLGFPQFKRALKVIEIEVQYAEDSKRAERRRAQSVFDYHHAAMDDVYGESRTSNETTESVNPLQLLTLNDIRSELLESNPVLEAFGNSKTIRNDNSSRFGKYLELQFNGQGGLIGGRVTTYLLEKARLVHQAENEQNFHVLHILTQGASSKQKDDYMLESPDSYHYLPSLSSTDKGAENEKFTLSTLQDSLRKIGISDNQQHSIFQLLSGILSLGNLTFMDNGADAASSVLNHDALARCCMLLHVDPGPLETALATHKLHQTGGAAPAGSGDGERKRRMTMAIAYHDQSKAAVIRDSLAKELYNRLFLWIVNTINTSIEYRGKQKRSIGILDIYGFEIFQDNHFEQFCINWVNEKLQQFFIDQTLRAEQAEYEAEDVPWTHIEYFDNKVVVDLIEQKVGILAILDDQQSFKNCSPESFTAAIKSSLGSNSHLVHPDVYARKNTSKSDFRFGIRHYAGEVCYNAVSFLDKNVDSLYEDVMKVMRTSKSPFIAELFADRRTDEEKSKRPPTIGNQFKKHLSDLVSTLKACKPHYVRCIKPNDEKSPDFTDTPRLVHQIQYLGIVENVKVRRAGYCLRTLYKDFLFRYRMLSAATWPKTSGDPVENARLILAGTTPTAWQYLPAIAIPPLAEGIDFIMGKTKVFIKEPLSLFALENARNIALYGVVRIFQASARKFVKWKQYKVIHRGFVKWQAKARAYLGQKHYKQTLLRITKTQSLIRKFIERCRFKKLMARCHGVPPRVYASKVQARARGMKCRVEFKTNDPEKYAKVQKCMENVALCGERRMLATAALRFYMRLKVRRVIAKRIWDAEYNETLSVLRSESGMALIKCRHNGTSAADKMFRLVDTQLIWNTGMFSKMKLGIGLHRTTQLAKGGHTFKTSAGRQSVAFQMKDNPFAKADRETSSDRGSMVSMEDMHHRAITIANPPQHEIIVVCRNEAKRDRLFAVLSRFCQECEEEGGVGAPSNSPPPPPNAK